MKKRKTVNAIDVTVILLAVFCLISCILRIRNFKIGGNGESLSQCRMVLRFENIDGTLADCYCVGENARISSDANNAIITAVRVEAAEEDVVSNGRWYEVTWDAQRRCTLVVEVDVRAQERGGVLYLDGRYATAISDSIVLCTNRTKMTGKLYGYTPLTHLQTPENIDLL